MHRHGKKFGALREPVPEDTLSGFNEGPRGTHAELQGESVELPPSAPRARAARPHARDGPAEGRTRIARAPFFIESGLLVAAASNDAREQLSQTLIDLGALNVAAATQAFEAARHRELALGEYLVEKEWREFRNLLPDPDCRFDVAWEGDSQRSGGSAGRVHCRDDRLSVDAPAA